MLNLDFQVFIAVVSIKKSVELSKELIQSKKIVQTLFHGICHEKKTLIFVFSIELKFTYNRFQRSHTKFVMVFI